jgi:hypothetical protein
MDSQIIEMAEALYANRVVRAEAARLRAVARAQRLRSRCHRGHEADEIYDEDKLRRVLCDFVSTIDPVQSWAGYSRGSVCQACGTGIEPNELEFYIATESAQLRLDLACYSTLTEWRAENSGDDPYAIAG